MDAELELSRNLIGRPARLNVEQAAKELGFKPHDIQGLVRAGLMTSLGRNDKAKNTTKYFATVEIDRLRCDPNWLSKATDVARGRWRRRGPRIGAGKN